MPYPRFTKVIINHFISKDKTISMRNMINLCKIRDDSLLDIKDSQAYKTYYDFATGKVPPRKAMKYKKVALPLRKFSPVKEAKPLKKGKRVKRPAKKSTTAPAAGVAIRDTPDVSVSKKKAPAKADRSKGDGTNFESRVPDEQQGKTSGTNEGTGTIPWVLDVPTYDSESENNSCGDSKDDNDDESVDDSKGDEDKANSDDDDGNSDANDNERTDSDDDDDENPSFTLKDYDEEEHDEEYETNDDNENVFEEEDDDLYKDMDSRQEESSTQAPSLFIVLVTAIPETTTAHAATVPLTISMITPPLQMTTPSPAPTTVPTITLIPELLYFSSFFGFDQRVFTLEIELSQLKQADHFVQLLKSIKSQLPTMVDDLLSTRIRYATRTSLESYAKDFEKKAQERGNFATPVIQSTINESLGNVILAKSSSQPKSTYEVAESLIEFKLKKILLDKIERRDRDDKDKDEDLFTGLDKGLKKRKTSKDAKPPKGSKSKESKTSSSKGTKSQPKSSGRSVQAMEPMFKTADTEMPQDQRGDTEDRPNVEVTLMDDWFKKPNKPPTPDRPLNDGKSIDSRPPQKWIRNIANVKQPSRMFNELMSTPIDFSAYVIHNLNIDNLT
nr:hypothetical protein [Tanacetum cinerariifolium]